MIRRIACAGLVTLTVLPLWGAVRPAAGEEEPPPTTAPPVSDYDVATRQNFEAGASRDAHYGGVGAAGEKSGAGVPAQQPLSPEEQAKRATGRAGIDAACSGVGGCAGSSGVPASPVVLAEAVHVRVTGMLPEPEVLSNPEPGVPSIIHVPVFVEVLNWLPVFTDAECAGSLCVTVSATPQLTFDPGEVGSTPVRCAGAGDRYVNDSDLSPDEQAEGACAYIYRKCTGITGRPKAWPGRVIVTWSLSWTASDGTSGSLPAVDKVAQLPKSVVEIQAVLVDPDDPRGG